MLADLVIDPATITVAIGTALTWLLGLSYVLGRYAERLKQTEANHQVANIERKEASDKTEATMKRIFDKLDELAKFVPHQCMQVDKLARIDTNQQVLMRRVEVIEHWKDEQGFHAAHAAERDHDKQDSS